MTDSERIAHLEKQLAELDDAPEARIREEIDLLNELAWLLTDTDEKRSLTLSEAAYNLAAADVGSSSAYKQGMAYSLRTQGYLNLRRGNHSTGLVQFMKAKETFESLGIIEGLPDVYDGIAGIHIQIGSFPNALIYIYKQLDAAKQIGDKRLIANAYNNLAVIYVESEDYEQVEPTRDLCLKLAIESGHTRIECISYINIAEMRLRTGNYQQALEFGLRGLNLSREAGFDLFEIYSLDTLGKTYLRLGETDKGLQTLESVLALSRKIDAKHSECMVLLGLGEAYLEMQDPDRAIEWLEQSLDVAQAINASVEVYRAQRVLSKAHEQKGNHSEALACYKQYHAIKGQVLSNVETLRTNILEISYQTETAKKEAEINNLKAIELEREVEKRTAEIQQMVELLEQRVADRSHELAALYDMTILYTEAQDLTDVLQPALANICKSVGAADIIVHIADSNSEWLHPAAQADPVSGVAMRPLPVNIALDKWLRETEAPEMFVSSGSGQHAFLPPELLAPDCRTYLSYALRVRGDVVGLLSVYRREERPFGPQNVSLLIMMAEQLGIIIQNHRLQAQSRRMAQALERQRLSRELHDAVAQHIYSLHLFGRAGREALDNGKTAEASSRLRQVDENALIALREMRLLLYQLRPPALENQTLVDAFKERFGLVEQRLGMRTILEADHAPTVNEAVEEELYYIISEALNNALKHAGAREVALRFAHHDDSLQITVEDDGRGFDPAQQPAGMGLENMRGRTEQIDAYFELHSSPGRGTTVRITLPGRPRNS